MSNHFVDTVIKECPKLYLPVLATEALRELSTKDLFAVLEDVLTMDELIFFANKWHS